MAYGNNRNAKQTRASFQTAGGSVIKFRHPFLAGQIDMDTTGGDIDEIDVSASLKLAATFLSATPNQDASSQEVLVDGSTVVITNHILNGTMTLPVIRTTGLVSSGDFLAALLLIVSSKDSVGGTLTRTMFIDGVAHTRLYYGVSVKSIPHDILMGLQVPEFSVQLFYAGFIDSISASGDLNLKAIWAVGSEHGVQGFYTPYEVQEGSVGSQPMSLANARGHGAGVADDLAVPPNRANADSTDETDGLENYPYINTP